MQLQKLICLVWIGGATSILLCSCDADSIGAPICGDGVLNFSEQCDGTSFDGLNCTDFGFNSGALICENCQIDVSICGMEPEVCGNGTIGGMEECEGDYLSGASCASLGFASGPLLCDQACMFDFSGCTPLACGNGTLDDDEECDDGNTINGDGCDATCRFEPVCGNGEIEDGEECDFYSLNGETCIDHGYDGGDLACTPICTFDETDCRMGPSCTIFESPSSVYTADFIPQTNCTCSSNNPECHILYRGKVNWIAGNLADLSFVKAQNGGAPTVDIHYWIVEGPQFPECMDVSVYTTDSRAEGTWSTTQSTLTISNLQIWPSQIDFDNALPFADKSLFIITGEEGNQSTPTYFQRTAITFTKVCQ